MLDERICCEDFPSYDDATHTVTYYFKLPTDFVPNIKLADYICLSLELPQNSFDPEKAVAEYTPVKNGQYYDWRETTLSRAFIIELLYLIDNKTIRNESFFCSYGSFEKQGECALVGFKYRNGTELADLIKKAEQDGWIYDGVYVPLKSVVKMPVYVNHIYSNI